MNRQAPRWAAAIAVAILMTSSMVVAQMATPVEEHKLLAKLAGDWDVVLHVMGNEMPGKETNELVAASDGLTRGEGDGDFDFGADAHIGDGARPARTTASGACRYREQNRCC